MAKKFSVIQRWMRSKSGQTFLNFAYSWGASIVVAGALFKITHMDGADIMLFLGMGTEVIVFFLAGFEPQEAVDITVEPKAAVVGGGTPISEETAAALASAAGNMSNVGTGGGIVGGGIVGGGFVGGGAPISEEAAAALASGAGSVGGGNVGGNVGGGSVVIIGGGAMPASMPEGYVPQEGAPVAEGAASVPTAPIFNSAQFNAMTPEMQESTKAYVEQLNELTETLKAVAEQSARLTRDSEEMETMNRTLTGINRFYEMQLRSVGTQSATIDEVNEQTKQLAAQLQELNEVYSKMVEALKMKIS